MEATPERFRALARSSPWRWTTLRCVLTVDLGARRPDPVRVFLRRPNLARTEHLDGELISVLRNEPRTVGVLSTGRRTRTETLPDPSTMTPERDGDGLVTSRPGLWEADDDAPMLGSYYEVALLDPVELADGGDEAPGTTVTDLRAVDHHGRPAWEAILEATDAYDPRCSCCPLLLCDVEGVDVSGLRDDDPAFAFPDAHRVRLDVATGICVEVEQLGGSRAGRGHVMRIEAVDEPIGDELFVPPARRGLSRWFGRR